MNKTVTVKMIDGTTFEAPAKGKVLSKDYVPTREQMDAIIEHNSGPKKFGTPEKEWRAIERRIEEADRLNRAENRKLTTYRDYDRKGNLIKR